MYQHRTPLALMIIVALLGLEDVGDPTDAAVQVAENIGVGCIVDWDWKSQDSGWWRREFLTQEGEDCGLHERAISALSE
jgi:hypothetical protein